MNERQADAVAADYLKSMVGGKPAPEAPEVVPTGPTDEPDIDPEDAILNALAEKHGDTDEQAEAGTQANDEPEEGEEDEVPEEPPVSEEDGDEAEDQDDEAAYAEALEVLSKAGWTAAEILALDRAAAIKTGQIMAKRQAPDTEQQTEDVPPAPQQQAPPVTPEEMAGLREALSVELGGESTDLLVSILERALATSRPDPQVETLKQSTDALRQLVLQQASNQARTQIQTDFPSLNDDGVYARVKQRMGRLAKTDEYDNVETLMRDACMLELPKDAAKKGSNGESRARKRRGQPSRPGRVSTNPEPTSKDEKLDALLQALADPDRSADAVTLGKRYLGR